MTCVSYANPGSVHISSGVGKDVQYLEQMKLSRPSAGAAYGTPESRSATGHAWGMVLTPPGPLCFTELHGGMADVSQDLLGRDTR